MASEGEKSLRIVFFGTPEYAVSTLEALFESRHQVVGVVCQPDKLLGRGRKTIGVPPVKQSCLNFNVPVLQPDTLKNNEAFMDDLRALKPDVAIVVAYGMYLHQKLLDLPPLGFYNSHGSVLPRWRGAAPINWAIIKGDKETGVTIQKVRLKYDTGPIAMTRTIPIEDTDDALTMKEKLCKLSATMMVEAMDKLADGTLELVEQDEAGMIWAPALTREDGLIDWSKSAVEVDRLVRGLKPWPGAYTWFRGQTLKIHLCKPVEKNHDAKPGTIIGVNRDEGLEIACGSDSSLLLKELQKQGSKAMAARDFINGHRIEAGETLGEEP